MDLLDKDFKFIFSSIIEFQNVLLALSSEEDFIEVLEENNGKFNEIAVKHLYSMKSKLSQYIRWELDYFFNMGEFNLYPLGRMIYVRFMFKYPELKSVSDLIDKINECDVSEIVKMIFAYQFQLHENKTIKGKINYDHVDRNTLEMIEIVKKSKFRNHNVKQKIIECFENPEETKQRYCLLLKQVYNNAFKLFEEDCELLVNQKKPTFENMLKDNPEKFTKDLLKIDYQNFKSTVYIHLSFFWNISFEYWPNLKESELIILGVDSLNTIRKTPTKDKVYNFLKTISDKSRLEIIELLSQRPWFVNELAEKLNISTATISYHLSKLQDLNIVDFNRSDQRFYYFLKKEDLKEVFDQTYKYLIKDVKHK